MEEIPIIGLGTWQLNGQDCVDVVSHALTVGYNHIDTAEFYDNEFEIGKAVAKIDRDKIWITNKVWWANLEHDKVIEACNNTLKKLNVNYLDLYLVHWPNKNIDLDETFKAMKKLLDQGKIKRVGVSNFTIKHLKNAMPIAEKYGFKIYANQVEFNPLLYQKELFENSVGSGKDYQQVKSEYNTAKSRHEGLKSRLLLLSLSPENVKKGSI